MSADLFDVVTPSDDPRVDQLRALLAGGADLAARDDSGATPLHHAVQTPYGEGDPLPSLEVVRALLESGADVQASDRNGVTPAGRAVVHSDTMPASAVDRSVQVLSLLVAHGARLDGPAGFVDGGSFAHHSCTAPAVYAFLLDHGAPMALANEAGDTPLHATVRSGRHRLVELLIQRGADLSAVNHLGQTPLGVALHLPEYTEHQRRARSEMIAVLEAAGGPAQVRYPVVPGGPLPIDMAVVRQAADALDDPRLKRCLTQTYSSYQHFIDVLMRTSATLLPSLLDVCRSTLDGAGTTRTMVGDQELRQPFFHHGDLTVQGNLWVLSRCLITGDLTVEGVLRDTGPDSRVAIGGDVHALGVHTDGETHVGGTLEADVVYAYYNDFTLTADTIKARLVIEDDHGVAADVEAEHHFDMDTFDQGYGDGVQDRLRAILVDEVFADDDENMLDRYALFDLLREGHPVFRGA